MLYPQLCAIMSRKKIKIKNLTQTKVNLPQKELITPDLFK